MEVSDFEFYISRINFDMHIDNGHFMFDFENEAWDAGFKNIAGLDEVGRGPLAGPVVAAAVVIPRGIEFPAVDDSKKLTEKQRIKLREEILLIKGLKYAIAEIQPKEIDRLNILKASQTAMINAALELVGYYFFSFLYSLFIN